MHLDIYEVVSFKIAMTAHTIARVGTELPAQAAQVKNSTAGCVLVQAMSAASGWKQFAILLTFF